MVRPWKRRPGWRKIAPASKEIIQVSFVRAREKSQEQQNVAMPMPLNAFSRGVVSGGGGRGGRAPPDFGRSVKPTKTKGGRLFPPNNTGIPEFSNLPTALFSSQLVFTKRELRRTRGKWNSIWIFHGNLVLQIFTKPYIT